MEQLTTRTAKLVPRIKKVKRVPGFATSYHFETDKQLEDSLGNLYVVIEVLTAGKQAEAVADLVIETIGKHYFDEEPIPEQPTLARFEDAVKATNQALAAYTNAGNGSWVGRLSAVIAVLCGEELHVTQAGSAEAYLYRGNASSHITADLQPKGVPKPVTTFSNIASGSVQQNDRLIIGTPALFHQINRTELKTLLTDNTANSAVQKISGLLGDDHDTDRVAAIVIEVTTPDMIAMTTLPDEPDEVHVGKPDSALETARAAALPAAQSAASAVKRVGGRLLQQAQNTGLPALNRLALGAADGARQMLKQKNSRRAVGGVLLIIIVALIWHGNSAARTKAINQGIATFNADYQKQANDVKLAATNKSAGRAALVTLGKDLSNLAASPYHAQIDAYEAKNPPLPTGPKSIGALQKLVSADIDQIDGISTVIPTQLAQLSTLSGAKPTHLEQVGTKLVMANQDGAIYVYDQTAKSAGLAASKPSGFGNVVATTASSGGDGVYLLTDQPSVWFFSIADNSLTKQSTGLDGWPKGKAIASYNGNLYILADDDSQIWKFIKTSGGFGAKTAYFASNVNLAGMDAMTINGSIYVAGTNGMQRYTQGKLDQTSTTIPDTLKDPNEISVVGNRILTRDAKSNRLGIFIGPDKNIGYDLQLVLSGYSKVTSATFDVQGGTIYIIADNKLVSTEVQ